MGSAEEEKRSLRRQLLARRKELKTDERDRMLRAQFLASPVYREARRILFYASFGSEPDTMPLIRQAIADGKQVYLPVSVTEDHSLILRRVQDPDNELAKGAYGIPEPFPSCPELPQGEWPDLVLVPGLAFTGEGDRLGYGGGYYDRFLAALPEQVRTAAIVYKELILPEIPVDKYDRKVQFVYSA